MDTPAHHPVLHLDSPTHLAPDSPAYSTVLDLDSPACLTTTVPVADSPACPAPSYTCSASPVLASTDLYLDVSLALLDAPASPSAVDMSHDLLGALASPAASVRTCRPSPYLPAAVVAGGGGGSSANAVLSAHHLAPVAFTNVSAVVERGGGGTKGGGAHAPTLLDAPASPAAVDVSHDLPGAPASPAASVRTCRPSPSLPAAVMAGGGGGSSANAVLSAHHLAPVAATNVSAGAGRGGGGTKGGGADAPTCRPYPSLHAAVAASGGEGSPVNAVLSTHRLAPTAATDVSGGVGRGGGGTEGSSAASVGKDEGVHAETANAAGATAPPPAATPTTREQPPDATAPAARGVVLGSSDPHMLERGDGERPLARTRPTFSLATHAAATVGDLISRPFPEMNVAPTTPPLPPPPPPPGLPPTVASLGEIAPPQSLRMVRRWLRMLRRCLRAARDGNLSLARRLRPSDLWMGVDRHMTDAARPYTWARGPDGSYAPVQESTSRWRWEQAGDGALHAVRGGERPRGCVAPDTSIDVDAVMAESTGFTDRAILDETARGLSDDSRCPRGTLLCAPHVGGIEFYGLVHSKCETAVGKGFASVGAELPFWPLRCNPYSIVDESVRAGEPKYRLTNDLSWPPPYSLDDGDGGFVDSVNGSMDRVDWPANGLVRVTQLGEALAILQSSGVRVKAWTADCRSYYRGFGRARGEGWRNCMALEDLFFADFRACFGSAADATKCCRFSNFLVFKVRQALEEVDRRYPTRSAPVLDWQRLRRAAATAAGASSAEAELWACLHTFSMYVDDGLGGSVDDELFDAEGMPVLGGDGVHVSRAEMHFEALISTWARFGFTSAPDKEQRPSLVVVALGVEMDLELRRMRLSVDKRLRYAAQIERLLAARIARRDEFRTMMGRLTFAAQCYPLGRQWLHVPWRAARAAYRTTDGAVVLGRGVQDGLRLWLAALRDSSHEGVPMASSGAFPPVGRDGCGAIYADASGSIGYAAWTVALRSGAPTVLLVEGTWSTEERSLLICELELLASTIGLVALAPLAGLSYVYSFTDNTVAEAAMRTLTPSTPVMAELTARRCEWLMARGVAESAERVSNKSNLWADLGSRGRTEEVERQARQLGLAFELVSQPAGWRCTAALLALSHEAKGGVADTVLSV